MGTRHICQAGQICLVGTDSVLIHSKRTEAVDSGNLRARAFMLWNKDYYKKLRIMIKMALAGCAQYLMFLEIIILILMAYPK